MKKNHGVLFGCAVIAIAALALFAGCSNGSTDDDAPTAVVLAAGSQGTAGNGKITGLVAGSTYMLFSGTKWYPVDSSDAIDTAKGSTDLATAMGADDANVNALTGTAITGLSNGTTYSVYEYFATPLDTTETIKDSEGTANTGGKNTIVNIDAATLANGESITIEDGASAGGASLVFLTGATQLAEAAGPVSVHTRIKGSGSGLTYSLSAVEGTANLAAVTEDDTYFIINNISADFTAVITATTKATAVKLAAKSWGTAASLSISDLAEGQYVVQHRGKWYATEAATTSALVATPYDNPAAAAAATTATGTTSITGLTNDEIYDVYCYKTSGSAITANGAYTGNKNIIIAETGDYGVSVAANAANANTIIFILDSAIAETGTTATSGTAPVTDQIIKTAGKTWTFTAVTASGVKVYFAVGDSFCILSGGDASTQYVLTRGNGA